MSARLKRRCEAWLPQAAALVLFVMIAYVPVWRGGFIWDDDNVITLNRNVQGGLDGLLRLWAGDAPDFYPLTWSLFWLEHKAWGLDATGYHLVNIALHALAVVVVWRVLVRLGVQGAWLGAALFAVHPVCVASAAWITEGKNTLSLLLGAASGLAWLKWRDDEGAYAPVLPLFAAALLAKSSVAPLPLVLAAVSWWKRGRLTSADARGLLPLVALAGLAGGASVWFQKHHVLFIDIVRPEGGAARLAASGMAVWYYAWTEVWPFDLPVIHPHWDVDAARPAAWLPLLAAVVALATLFWKRAAWGRGPLAAALCWLAFLSPVLGFFDIYFMKFSLVADHWAYLSTAVAMACAGAAVARLPKEAAWGVGAAACIGFGVLTARQAAVYASSETLWRTALQRNPTAWVGWHNLGYLQETSGRPDDAVESYQNCLRLKPDFALSHHNLGLLLRARGRIDEAIGHYEAALESRPDFPAAHYDLALALMAKGRPMAAIEHYRKAIALQPDFVEARANLAAACNEAGEFAEAEREAHSALQMRPDEPRIELILGRALEGQGRLAEAIEHDEAALRAAPDFAPAMVRIAWLRATAPDDALRDGARALQLAARAAQGTADAETLDAYAAALAECGQFRAAVETATRAASLAGPTRRAAIEKRISLYNAMLPYRLDVRSRSGAPAPPPR